jgi:hypothetical protein
MNFHRDEWLEVLQTFDRAGDRARGDAPYPRRHGEPGDGADHVKQVKADTRRDIEGEAAKEKRLRRDVKTYVRKHLCVKPMAAGGRICIPCLNMTWPILLCALGIAICIILLMPNFDD